MSEVNDDKQSQQLFDINRPIRMKALTSEGIKIISVRFPSDEEWIERARRIKFFQKYLPGGVTADETSEPDETETELLRKLRTEAGPDIEASEAYRILDSLNRAEVIECVQEGNGFKVLLRANGILTAHIMRMATVRERDKWDKKFSSDQYIQHSKKRVYVFDLHIAGVLYKDLCEKTEGYAAAVPISHQVAVVSAVFQELKHILEDANATQNF